MIGLGRLFWKLFLGFWLTLVATGATVGTAVWIHQQQRAPGSEPALAAGPRAELLLRSAAATLRYGGEPALRELLEDEAGQVQRAPRLYAVDEHGDDLIGRPVPAEALELARDRAAGGGSSSGSGSGSAEEPNLGFAARERRSVRVVAAPGGRSFLLFVAPATRAGSPANEQAEARPPQVTDRSGTGAATDAQTGTQPKAAAEARAASEAGAAAEARAATRARAASEAGRAAETASDAMTMSDAPSRHRTGGRPAFPISRRSLDPLAVLAIGLLASLAFSALLAWYLTRPIRHLRDAFASVASGGLQTRVGSLMGRRTDEIANLGHDFDRMAEQLQNLIVAQRRLLHDVSHELRSPLARLHAAIGLARQNPARAAAMMERIEREAQRIDSLVGELLTLARLDAGETRAGMQPVDLVELLAEVVSDAGFEARAQDRDVRFDAPGSLTPQSRAAMVHGRADWLQRAFENVIRNAVRHAPTGSAVEVRLSAAPGATITIEIADSGPGVPVDELESIFEPFNRGRRPPGAPGHGLGLAIARRAIAAHGGSIAASNRKGGGLLVTIALPAAEIPHPS